MWSYLPDFNQHILETSGFFFWALLASFLFARREKWGKGDGFFWKHHEYATSRVLLLWMVNDVYKDPRVFFCCSCVIFKIWRLKRWSHVIQHWYFGATQSMDDKERIDGELLGLLTYNDMPQWCYCGWNLVDLRYIKPTKLADLFRIRGCSGQVSLLFMEEIRLTT